jgi:hypothetical protein
MAMTDSYRQQHRELADLQRQIEVLLVPARLAADAQAVRSLLSSFLGKLNIHLAMEDRSLYPRLQAGSDQDLRAMAHHFAEEMAGLKREVAEFGGRWTAAAIAGDATRFCEEARRVFAAFAARIGREDKELYALADRMV